MSEPIKYKTKENYMMKDIAGDFIVIPRGSEALDFKGTVVFNETGAFLWEKLQSFTDEPSLSNALREQYGVDSAVAEQDTRDFLKKMEENGLLETSEG